MMSSNLPATPSWGAGTPAKQKRRPSITLTTPRGTPLKPLPSRLNTPVFLKTDGLQDPAQVRPCSVGVRDLTSGRARTCAF